MLYHTNPKMSILEAGSGNVDFAPMVLLNRMPKLQEVLKTAEYTISCPRADAVARAQEKLSIANEVVKFAVFDVEMAPESQEVRDRKFDVVIAFNITGSVANPELALSNTKNLLNEGGRLYLIEMSRPGLYLSVLGCSASTRYEKCLRSVFAPVADRLHSALDTLEPLLPRNGFGNVLRIHDFEQPDLQQVSLLIADSKIVEEKVEHTEVVILEPPTLSEAAKELSGYLSGALERLSFKTSSLTWDPEMPSLKGRTCISLMELEGSYLADLGENDFLTLRKVIMDTKDLLWIVGFDGPYGSMISGVARVVRNEVPGLSFRIFHTSEKSLGSASELSSDITRVFSSNSPDTEFKIEAGTICVSRIEEDTAVNAEVDGFLPHTGDRIEKIQLGQVSGPQKLCIQTPGKLESLCFEVDALPTADLESDQVEIDVKATALK